MAVTLVLIKKDGRRKTIPLIAEATVIGRRPDCNIRLPFGTVSRKHCRIIQREDEIIVQDLGSINGTFVNNEKVAEAVIGAGDVLSVASVMFTVQVDGQPEQIDPPTRQYSRDNAADLSGSANFDSAQPTNLGQQSVPITEGADDLDGSEPLANDFTGDDSDV